MSDLVGNPEDRFSQNEAQMAKECKVSTDKLHCGDLPRNSMVRIIDSLDMILAVYHVYHGH